MKEFTVEGKPPELDCFVLSSFPGVSVLAKSFASILFPELKLPVTSRILASISIWPLRNLRPFLTAFSKGMYNLHNRILWTGTKSAALTHLLMKLVFKQGSQIFTIKPGTDA